MVIGISQCVWISRERRGHTDIAFSVELRETVCKDSRETSCEKGATKHHMSTTGHLAEIYLDVQRVEEGHASLNLLSGVPQTNEVCTRW